MSRNLLWMDYNLVTALFTNNLGHDIPVPASNYRHWNYSDIWTVGLFFNRELIDAEGRDTYRNLNRDLARSCGGTVIFPGFNLSIQHWCWYRSKELVVQHQEHTSIKLSASLSCVYLIICHNFVVVKVHKRYRIKTRNPGFIFIFLLISDVFW